MEPIAAVSGKPELELGDPDVGRIGPAPLLLGVDLGSPVKCLSHELVDELCVDACTARDNSDEVGSGCVKDTRM